MNGSNGNSASHTLTGLKRWSCQDKSLPAVSQIKCIHVYDFDNTLFASPTPNKQLWNSPTIGQLQNVDAFIGGGWWHNSGILSATGEGLEKEELKAWTGWWNEQIVSLVELSMEQKDAVSILLTGRAEDRFAELIKRMLRSKNLEFDMVCLKPAVGPNNQRFESTMSFKQDLLRDMVHTYKEADEIRVYEDRPKHVKGFRDFFFAFNKALMSPNPPLARKTITAEVIHVESNAVILDPTTEVAQIQSMINDHNIAIKSRTAPSGILPYQIKRSVFYTAYLIPPESTEKLLTLVNLPPSTPDGEVRNLANSILITPRPCPPSIMEKVGGIGKKVTWRVTGVSYFENKLWAARVEPVSEPVKNIYSENSTPTVVLALRRNARPVDASRIQNWHPVPDDKAFEFESTVGEKVLLRVEEENNHESQYESYFPNKQQKWSHHGREDGFISLNSAPPSNARHPQHQWPQRPPDDRRQGGISGNYRGGNQYRGRGDRRGPPHGRGGRDARGRGGGGRGRGRGGGNAYRSLDDVGDNGQGGNNGYPSYDDY